MASRMYGSWHQALATNTQVTGQKQKLIFKKMSRQTRSQDHCDSWVILGHFRASVLLASSKDVSRPGTHAR